MSAMAPHPHTATHDPVTVRAADSPRAHREWDLLAAPTSFYCGAPWLEFSDTDHVAEARYLVAESTENTESTEVAASAGSGGADGTARPVAGLVAHWSPRENNERYVPERVFPDLDRADVLTLGGRRGYLSGPLAAPGPTPARRGAAFGALIDAAAAWRPAAQGRWWWPYLTGEDAGTVRTALSAAGHGPVAARLIGADCSIAVPEGGLDAHIAALTAKQRRTNARRELRAFTESGLRIVRATLAEHVDTLGPLLANVQQRYGHDHSAGQMTSLLRRQADHLQDSSVVFLCRTPDDDRTIGFCLAYRHGRSLAVRVVGFDYDRLPGAAEYAQLAVYEPLRYCHESGLDRLELGMESFEAKCRRGAALRPLWALSHGLPAPAPGTPDARRDALLAALPAYEAELFRTATEAGPA
ncbi:MULTISPECIES: GNAT family N-acetyltransferase [Streptomyces]|nr:MULTISPECIES: GNAT family N-acetyltransferase [Streptomyces]MDI7791421.1 GNAT family N-acetyltransferase [Streptomyces cavourensis]